MSFLIYINELFPLLIYCSFFGPFCVNFGGQTSLISLLYYGLIYLAFYKLNSKKKSFFPGLILILLPMYLLKMNLVTILFQVPMIIFIVYQVFYQQYILSYEKIAEIFQPSFLVYVGYFIIMSFYDQYNNLLTNSLPFALLLFTDGIILLRSLRHQKEVYRSYRFQAINISALVLCGLVCFVLSIPTVLEAFEYILYHFYNTLIIPAITFILYGLLYVFEWIFSIFDNLTLDGTKFTPTTGNIPDFMEGLRFDDIEVSDTANIIIAIIYVAIGLFLIFLIYYYFLRNSRREQNAVDYQLTSEDLQMEEKNKLFSLNDPILGIRRQYKKFMKFYVQSGKQIEPQDTSLDIQNQADMSFKGKEEMHLLRQLYLSARYGNKGTSQQLKQAREYFGEIRKANKK